MAVAGTAALWLIAARLLVELTHGWPPAARALYGALLAVPLAMACIRVVLGLASIALPRHRQLILATGDGLAPAARTMLAVPAIIHDRSDIEDACRCILDNILADPASGVDPVILYDFADSPERICAGDEAMREHAVVELARLNARLAELGANPASHGFRGRVYDPVDRKWMGWERKRGKLVEFMRLSRGDRATSFEGRPPGRHYEYLITLDVDSRLSRGGLSLLRAAIEAARRQSRRKGFRPAIVTPMLDVPKSSRDPLHRKLCEPSFFRDAWAGPEPSERQSLFGTDYFFGKGIIHIDDFLRRADASIPTNTVLSHDHLEGLLCGASSTHRVRVFEPFPSDRAAWERRQHRWTRGDFQLLAWTIFGRHPDAPAEAHSLGPWRRMQLAAILGSGLTGPLATLAALAGVVAWSAGASFLAVAIPLTIIADYPARLLALLRMLTRRHTEPVHSAREFADATAAAIVKGMVDMVAAHRNAALMLDAAFVSLWRVARGRRDLLEWFPARRDSPLARRLAAERFILAAFVLAWLAGLTAMSPVLFTGIAHILCLTVFDGPKRRSGGRAVASHATGGAPSTLSAETA